MTRGDRTRIRPRFYVWTLNRMSPGYVNWFYAFTTTTTKNKKKNRKIKKSHVCWKREQFNARLFFSVLHVWPNKPGQFSGLNHESWIFNLQRVKSCCITQDTWFFFSAFNSTKLNIHLYFFIAFFKMRIFKGSASYKVGYLITIKLEISNDIWKIRMNLDVKLNFFYISFVTKKVEYFAVHAPCMYHHVYLHW